MEKFLSPSLLGAFGVYLALLASKFQWYNLWQLAQMAAGNQYQVVSAYTADWEWVPQGLWMGRCRSGSSGRHRHSR